MGSIQYCSVVKWIYPKCGPLENDVVALILFFLLKRKQLICDCQLKQLLFYKNVCNFSYL